MIIAGYVRRWMTVVCMPKAMRAGLVRHRLTTCAGRRRRMKATTDVGWPLCASQRRCWKATPMSGDYYVFQRRWVGQHWMLLDIFFCNPMATRAVHARWKLIDVIKPRSLQAVHSQCRLSNEKATSNAGS